MVYLKRRVTCHSCKNLVEKVDARLVEAPLGGPRYECYSCFKKGRSRVPGEEFEVKQELYCGRCNYRFRSKKLDCPYCNQSNAVMPANISVNDLL